MWEWSRDQNCKCYENTEFFVWGWAAEQKTCSRGSRLCTGPGGSPARPGGTLINFTCSCPSASKGSF